MTGQEFIEVGLQAFVVGLILGALVGVVKAFLHNALN